MDKGSWKNKSEHTLEWLYDKLWDKIPTYFKAYNIIKSYSEGSDQEILCLLYAMMNNKGSHVGAFTAIIGMMGDNKPTDWIKSESLLFGFASHNRKDLFHSAVKTGVLVDFLQKLRSYYEAKQDIQKSVLDIDKENPSRALFRFIFGAEKDKYDYIDHVGVNTALMFLARPIDNHGLGLWLRVKKNKIYPPIDRSILAKINTEGLVDCKRKDIALNLHELLCKLDKEDPLKYIPIFKTGKWERIVDNLGYSYIGHLDSTKLFISSYNHHYYHKREKKH